jgi:hypothetical protein
MPVDLDRRCAPGLGTVSSAAVKGSACPRVVANLCGGHEPEVMWCRLPGVPMHANIEAIRDGADAINRAELALSGVQYELSFAAEYGHGSTREAIRSLDAAQRHADRAVIATAAGNPLMAAKHEAQSVLAEEDAVRMLDRAKGYADDLTRGLRTATEGAESALGLVRSLVGLDDSSPAAEIHAKIAEQPVATRDMAQRAEEIHRRIAGSRDPAELRVAAEHFLVLRDELEEGSGRAQQIAADSVGYSSTL